MRVMHDQPAGHAHLHNIAEQGQEGIQEEFTREIFDFCQLCHSSEDGLWNKYDGEKVCYACIEKYQFSTETDNSVKNRGLWVSPPFRGERTVILSGDY